MIMTEDRKSRIETAFVGLHGADVLLDHREGERASPAVLPALMRAATDPAAALPAQLVGRMATDPRLRADFKALLTQVARYRLPRAAAASTGALDRRIGTEGLTLRLKFSAARPDQVHVLIDLPEEGTAPQVLILTPPEGVPVKLALEEPIDGILRILLAADDPIVSFLGDPGTEIDLI